MTVKKKNKDNNLKEQWLAARKRLDISRRAAAKIIPIAVMTLSAFERPKPGAHPPTERTLAKIRKQLAKWNAPKPAVEPMQSRIPSKPQPHDDGLSVAVVADLRREVDSLTIYLDAGMSPKAQTARVRAFRTYLDLCLPAGAAK